MSSPSSASFVSSMDGSSDQATAVAFKRTLMPGMGRSCTSILANTSASAYRTTALQNSSTRCQWGRLRSPPLGRCGVGPHSSTGGGPKAATMSAETPPWTGSPRRHRLFRSIVSPSGSPIQECRTANSVQAVDGVAQSKRTIRWMNRSQATIPAGWILKAFSSIRRRQSALFSPLHQLQFIENIGNINNTHNTPRRFRYQHIGTI